MGQSGWTREKRRRIREWNVYTLGAQIIPTPPDLPQGSPPAQPTLAPSSTTSTPTFPNAPSCPPSLTSSLTGHGSVTSRMWLAFGCLLCKEIVKIQAQGCQGRTPPHYQPYCPAGEAARRGFPIFNPLRAARNPCAPLARRARTADEDIFYEDVLLPTAHKP